MKLQLAIYKNFSFFKMKFLFIYNYKIKTEKKEDLVKGTVFEIRSLDQHGL